MPGILTMGGKVDPKPRHSKLKPTIHPEVGQMQRRQRWVISTLVSRAHSGNAVLRPHPAWIVGPRLSNTGDWAAPFEKHHVTPPTIQAANPLPRSHNSKPGLP